MGATKLHFPVMLLFISRMSSCAHLPEGPDNHCVACSGSWDVVHSYKVQFSNDSLVWKPCMNGTDEAVSDALRPLVSCSWTFLRVVIRILRRCLNSSILSVGCRSLKGTRIQRRLFSPSSTPQWPVTSGSTRRPGTRMGRRVTSA